MNRNNFLVKGPTPMKARLAHLISCLAERLRLDQRGATATEYSMLVGFMVFAMVAGVQLFGFALLGAYNELTTQLKAVAGIP